MKKINLAERPVRVDKAKLLQAMNSGKPFGITVEGEVREVPFDREGLYIYQGSVTKRPGMLGGNQIPTLAEHFGPTYKITEEADHVMIDASGAWNEIVPLNRACALYDDTTSDGIMDFEDEVLEEISWHAIEFGITNRDIGEIIESSGEGRLFCVHREAPFFFSALVYVDDIEDVRQKVHKAVSERIAKVIETDPDYDPELFDEEQEEAAAYFGLGKR